MIDSVDSQSRQHHHRRHGPRIRVKALSCCFLSTHLGSVERLGGVQPVGGCIRGGHLNRVRLWPLITPSNGDFQMELFIRKSRRARRAKTSSSPKTMVRGCGESLQVPQAVAR